jgi:hypothetical protein
MRDARTQVRRPTGPGSLIGLALLLGLLAAAAPAAAATGSARYRFEGNKWLTVDLTVDEVRAQSIRFDWPATVMGLKTGYKATVRLTNGSTRQVGIGVAVVLYDPEARPTGAGTTGSTLGTIDPGDSAQFTVDFKDVTERLEQSEQFALVLEIR